MNKATEYIVRFIPFLIIGKINILISLAITFILLHYFPDRDFIMAYFVVLSSTTFISVVLMNVFRDTLWEIQYQIEWGIQNTFFKQKTIRKQPDPKKLKNIPYNEISPYRNKLIKEIIE